LKLITDHQMPDPVVQALLAVKFDVVRVKELTPVTDDLSVMQACVDADGILITRDVGIPSKAYLYGFAQKGLTVVLLRWKHDQYRDWQQMVEIILRDAHLWEQIASTSPSIISISYAGGSRARSWSRIPTIIALQALTKANDLSRQRHLL
jgi:predicted nuclease of predicted toxin-antitoxin system